MKISPTQYARTLFELTENKSQEDVLSVVKKFAEALKAHGQLKNIGKIMEKFSDIYNKQNGIVYTQVYGRQQVSQDILEKVREFIKKKYEAKEVEMNFVVDEKIKGGIIIKVGDEIIDGSVQKQLINLKKVLYS